MTTFHAEVEFQIEPDVAERAGYVAVEPGRLGELVRFTLEAESAIGDWAIVVVLTSDEHLRSLHNQFMGINEETDVMTFPYDPEPGTSSQGGDIVISVDRATDNAVAFGLSPAEEIAFLTVHGTLHLCGWNDLDHPSREQMLARQRSIIDAFEARPE